MPGFSSSSDFVAEAYTAGKYSSASWNKTTQAIQIAGESHLLYTAAGTPTADALFGTGTNLAFQALTDTTTGAAGIPHGGAVSTDLKYVLSASVFSAGATTAPNTFILVDILGFYPITTVTTTGNQALNNAVAFPARHTNGIGLKAMLVASTATGAGVPTIQLTYDSNEGTGHVTPATLPTAIATCKVGQVPWTGAAAAGHYGPFFPLAGGDTGIKQVTQFNLSATMTSGVINLVIVRPLLEVPVLQAGVVAERNFINHLPSMPRVRDGAVLAWVMNSGAATPNGSVFYGDITFGWG